MWTLTLLAWAQAATPEVLDLRGEVYAEAVQGPASEVAWWETLGSSELDALMAAALGGGNFDALAAWSRVEQADAIARQNLANLFPTATFDFAVNTQPLNAFGFQAQLQGAASGAAGAPGGVVAAPTLVNTGSAQFNASWPIDLFGRSFLTWRASRFDALATEGDREATLVALATRVAEAWLDVVAANRRLDVLDAQLVAQESLLELIQLRYEHGTSSAVEVLQQRQQVSALRSQVPGARSVQRTRSQQLAVLVGRLPSEVRVAQDALPEPPPTPATGIPAELVTRRPDLRAASRRIDAAHARKVAAVRALLPSLRLTAQAGWQGAELGGDLGTTDVWSVGGALSVPLFQGGRTLAGMKAARAGEDLSVYQYNGALLTAVGEVEGALTLEQERRLQLSAATEQSSAANAAYDNARDRYLAGLDSYTTVLTAWNALQQAELSLLLAQRDLLGARVQLHDALAGAWTTTVAVGGDR